MAAEPPPTLLQMEPALLADGPADAHLATANAKRAAAKGAGSQLEDIINSILPPR